MDFYQVKDRQTKSGVEVFADFVVRPSKDLMVRGGAFYAVWDERAGLWSQDEYTVQNLIDADLYAEAEKLSRPEVSVTVRSLSSFASKSWMSFRSYIGNMPDSHKQLDSTLAFSNTPPRKADLSSKRLPYALEAGSITAYDKLMSVLYAPEEREKLEWAIGAIVSGDSKRIQKFVVLYGEAGTGKSTFLNIVQQMFDGYYMSFDAKSITGSNNTFATEVFKDNPLIAIQHDGDLSKIEDNTRLNSIVSHEEMTMNEKYRSAYTGKVNAFLLMGTNQSVRITDAKSGLIRRLIDVHPTGRKVAPDEYNALMTQISFELGAIAHHCLQEYRKRGKSYYSNYRPLDMMVRTDVFYNFLVANFDLFKEQDGVTLKQAWSLYKEYIDEAGLDFKMNLHRFRDELRNYFEEFHDRIYLDGVDVRSWYAGFKTDKLGSVKPFEPVIPSLAMDYEISLLDEALAGQPAQYASSGETPKKEWAKVTTTLSEIDTRKLHFVKPGENYIVIDFDLKDDSGEKSLERNLAAASLWPATYAEFSKGEAGIHLHYLYDGDVATLSSVYEDGIEVKTFRGDASLRRKLTKCNNIPVATINSGLPLKERRVIDADTIRSERGLRAMILRNLLKEFHPATKPSIDFIWKILDDAYNSGLTYDVTDMRGRVLAFANNSTNNAMYCVKMVMSMKFASESDIVPEQRSIKPPKDDRLVFYDLEVFPNLFVACWMFDGSDTVVRMVNPTPKQAEELAAMKLVGFNNRRWDNHILYARMMGYSNQQLFDLSQKMIVAKDKHAFFADAYNISHADIYDFSSRKTSLKVFQIELGLNHQELGLPWDQPVPEELWEKVTDYCANDVVTTKEVFASRKQDYVARQILAALSGLSVNDTTQRHTARIIFGNDRRPQEKFKYTDLSERFPGYSYEFGKSTYRDIDPGEGGYVYAEPGMYSNVAVLDVASMHPTSIELLELFGPYTERYTALKNARVAIKRKQYAEAKKMLGGALAPYLDSEDDAKALSDALKIAINIVYGLTSASFDNPFRDLRNKDNIVAKRGALFMIDLMKAVQDKGLQVVHIKTDSIKIPDASPEIIDYVMQFGRDYGYEFEHEVTYEKFCLVNDAVYIAKTQGKKAATQEVVLGDGETALSDGKWTATGAQFANPYVFKTLFSGEEIIFDDYVQTKTVTAALYLKFGEDEPHFVGRAGAFVPVQPGTGGGQLLRGKDGAFHSATGAKGFDWREAVTVRELGLEGDIDLDYYRKLVDAALANISKFGDAEWFRS
jgi:hypothetical protein